MRRKPVSPGIREPEQATRIEAKTSVIVGEALRKIHEIALSEFNYEFGLALMVYAGQSGVADDATLRIQEKYQRSHVRSHIETVNVFGVAQLWDVRKSLKSVSP